MKLRRNRGPTGLGFTVLPIFTLTIALGLVFVFAGRLSGEAVEAGVALENLVPLIVALVLFAVLSVIVLVYTSILHSRRMTGPIHRITSSLRSIAAGKRSVRVRVRQDDYLAEVVREINNTLDSLNAADDLPRKLQAEDRRQPVRCNLPELSR